MKSLLKGEELWDAKPRSPLFSSLKALWVKGFLVKGEVVNL